MENENNSRYRNAVEYSKDFFERFDEIFGISLEEAFELDFVSLFIETHPNIGTHYTESGGVYHSLPDYLGQFLSGAAQDMPEAFGLVREICARNTFEGKPLPYSLRCVAFSMIKGTFPAAIRRGRKGTPDFGKRWLIYSEALLIRDAFNLPLTRNEASAAISACDVIVEALGSLGVAMKYELARDWCTSAKYADLRRRADYFSDYFKGLALNEWGALKRPQSFGPIQEFLRMTDQK